MRAVELPIGMALTATHTWFSTIPNSGNTTHTVVGGCKFRQKEIEDAHNSDSSHNQSTVQQTHLDQQ